MEYLLMAFMKASTREKLLILLVPAIPDAFLFGLYFGSIGPRLVEGGYLSAAHEADIVAAAPLLFIGCWAPNAHWQASLLIDLKKGRREDLSTLTTEYATYRLKLKCGQTVATMIIYLFFCMPFIPPRISALVVMGTGVGLGWVVRDAGHWLYIVLKVRERDAREG